MRNHYDSLGQDDAPSSGLVRPFSAAGFLRLLGAGFGRAPLRTRRLSALCAAAVFSAFSCPVLKSTSSRTAISAASPSRCPRRTMRVYPPGRVPTFPATAVKSLLHHVTIVDQSSHLTPRMDSAAGVTSGADAFRAG